MLGQTNQMPGDISAKQQQDKSGNQEGLDRVAGQQDNDALHQTMTDPLQGGGDMQPADFLVAATDVMLERKDLGDTVLAGKRVASGPGDLTIHFHRGVNDILTIDQALKLEMNLQFIKNPDTRLHGTKAGFFNAGEKGVDVLHIAAIIKIQLKGGGKNSHQGTEQDHLEGQAKGYAVRFPAHHSDNLFLWLYGLILSCTCLKYRTSTMATSTRAIHGSSRFIGKG
jgi:hypothetical protein